MDIGALFYVIIGAELHNIAFFTARVVNIEHLVAGVDRKLVISLIRIFLDFDLPG